MDDKIDLTEQTPIGVAATEMKLLRAEVEVLATNVQKLASKEEVAEVDKKNKNRVYSLWLPVVLIFLMVLFNFAVGFRTRDKIDDTRIDTQTVVDLTEDVKRLNGQIADCLDPEGECAKRNAAQTQKVIQQIIDGVNAQP